MLATPKSVPIATTACIPVTVAAAVVHPSDQKPTQMHAVIAGATGTGKTVYMTSQINALDSSVYQNIQTAFSAQTSANQIQDIIDLKLDKRRKVPLMLPCCSRPVTMMIMIVTLLIIIIITCT